MGITIEDYHSELKGDLGGRAQTTDCRLAGLVQGVVGVGWCGFKEIKCLALLPCIAKLIKQCIVVLCLIWSVRIAAMFRPELHLELFSSYSSLVIEIC